MKRASTEQFAHLPALPLAILLDDVRSAHNVGAIFRTADAFRLHSLALCGITPQPPHPLIHKTALGAELSMRFSYFRFAQEAIAHYKMEGFKIWVLEQTTDSTPPEKSPLEVDEKVLLVVGNEVHGVKEEIVATADRCIEIPQYGTKHSLNVSVSTGIAIYSIVAGSLSQLSLTD